MQTPATVTDYTAGVAHSFLPQPGIANSLGTTVAGAIVERELGQNLPRQGVYAAQNVVARHLGGASSYDQLLTDPVATGEQTFSVQTTRGLFKGQKLFVTSQPQAYGAGEEVTVESLGVQIATDASGATVLRACFVAEAPAAMNHPAQALVYNKNVVTALAIQDISNCDNQSYGLQYEKTVYGLGDSFVFSGSLTYQNDIVSGAGDEGAVGAAVVLNHDLESFWGTVESWNPLIGELSYRPGATSPQKIGTSRALINMNPNKWVQSPVAADTPDRILVTRPNEDPLRVGIVIPNYSQITARKQDVGWDSSVVGRFIAVNEPTEYFEAGEGLANGSAPTHRVYRWWHITGITERTGFDGSTFQVLSVESHNAYATSPMGPTLFRNANFCDVGPGNVPILRLLRYIIAPGAWISDVRNGIAGNIPGNRGIANASEDRRLVLAPSPTRGTSFDFAPTDPITNPPGSDVWLPTGVRVRHWDNYPGRLRGSSFSTESNSKVQLAAGLSIDAPNARTLDAVAQHQKDQRTGFANGISISAATDYGLMIWGDVPEILPSGNPGAAILLQQTNIVNQTNVKAIQWTYVDRTDPQLPRPGTARLYVDPDHGNLVFAGGHMDHQQGGLLATRGISGTSIPAQNLRGIDVAVPALAGELVIAFLIAEPDAVYAVQVMPSWLTACAVTTKTPQSFTIAFATPANVAASLDWVLVR